MEDSDDPIFNGHIEVDCANDAQRIYLSNGDVISCKPPLGFARHPSVPRLDRKARVMS